MLIQFYTSLLANYDKRRLARAVHFGKSRAFKPSDQPSEVGWHLNSLVCDTDVTQSSKLSTEGYPLSTTHLTTPPFPQMSSIVTTKTWTIGTKLYLSLQSIKVYIIYIFCIIFILFYIIYRLIIFIFIMTSQCFRIYI